MATKPRHTGRRSSIRLRGFREAYQGFLRRHPDLEAVEPEEWLWGVREPATGRDFAWGACRPRTG
jgi:hypothetical protein